MAENRGVDPNKVIDHLAQQIASQARELAIAHAAIVDLQAELVRVGSGPAGEPATLDAPGS